MSDRQVWRRRAVVLAAVVAAVFVASVASSQLWDRGREARSAAPPDAEFHMGRMVYDTRGCGGSRGFCNPWWAVDYPEAEAHFLPALRRMTNISVADDSRHLRMTDDSVFDYPWLLVQQVGRGNWSPSQVEVERLREYLLRGGFLVVDDFHGQLEWALLEAVMRRVLPDRPIVDIPADDRLLSIFYDLDLTIRIPGERHVRGWQTQGPPRWRGIYDDRGRLMVAINFNSDMGDAWEHADDRFYPTEMTALAYRFGVNYVIYAMTQ